MFLFMGYLGPGDSSPSCWDTKGIFLIVERMCPRMSFCPPARHTHTCTHVLMIWVYYTLPPIQMCRTSCQLRRERHFGREQQRPDETGRGEGGGRGGGINCCLNIFIGNMHLQPLTTNSANWGPGLDAILIAPSCSRSNKLSPVLSMETLTTPICRNSTGNPRSTQSSCVIIVCDYGGVFSWWEGSSHVRSCQRVFVCV